jgi:iron(III) transport system ATP-binding protein
MDATIFAKESNEFVKVKDYCFQMDNLSEECLDGMPVKISVRPEEFIIRDAKEDGIPAIVKSSIFLGITTHYFVEIENGTEMEIIQNSDVQNIIPDGTPIKLAVQTQKINVFNSEGTKNLINWR